VGAAKQVLSAVKSPWFWPVMPLLAIALVGRWVGVFAAEVVAAACAAIGIGIVIGFAIAGEGRGIRHQPPNSADTSTSAANPAGPSATAAPVDATPTVIPGATDLRGALLVNTTLIRADLRHADLRGATLRGADLSGADLTGARLGPQDDGMESNQPAAPATPAD
jgi:hypothetical protein